MKYLIENNGRGEQEMKDGVNNVTQAFEIQKEKSRFIYAFCKYFFRSLLYSRHYFGHLGYTHGQKHNEWTLPLGRLYAGGSQGSKQLKKRREGFIQDKGLSIYTHDKTKAYMCETIRKSKTLKTEVSMFHNIL